MTELREEIIKKAFLQFLNRGYKACSLKTLEQATGLTKGAFYYYFKDKKEILEAGMERYFSVMKEESEEDVERVTSLREYIDLVIKNKEGAKAVKWSCEGNPEYTLEETEKAERGTDIIMYSSEEEKDFLEASKVYVWRSK